MSTHDGNFDYQDVIRVYYTAELWRETDSGEVNIDAVTVTAVVLLVDGMDVGRELPMNLLAGTDLLAELVAEAEERAMDGCDERCAAHEKALALEWQEGQQQERSALGEHLFGMGVAMSKMAINRARKSTAAAHEIEVDWE